MIVCEVMFVFIYIFFLIVVVWVVTLCILYMVTDISEEFITSVADFSPEEHS